MQQIAVVGYSVYSLPPALAAESLQFDENIRIPQFHSSSTKIPSTAAACQISNSVHGVEIPPKMSRVARFAPVGK
jgi:hypothetical protein